MRKPLLLTAQYSVATESGPVEMLGHVSPVDETGWGVVVHKPVEAAFDSARRMVVSAVLAGLLLLVAAVVLALVRVAQDRRHHPPAHPHDARDRGRQLRPPHRGRALRRRALGSRRGLQPDERARRGARRPAQRGGAPEPRAVHQLGARLLGGDRRQGSLHQRPLRPGRRAVALDRPPPRPGRGGPAEGLDRRAPARHREDRRRRPHPAQRGRADAGRVRADEGAPDGRRGDPARRSRRCAT